MPGEPLTVVIPCYNEESTILDVLQGVAGSLEDLGRSFEIIVVDDGSTDGTRARLEGSAVPVRVLRNRFNRGYGASVKAGIRAAAHEWILIMDADGQHRPEEIARLFERCEEADMVVGARRSQGSHHWRMPGKYVLRKVCEALVGQRIPDVNSGFRLLRRSEALKYLGLCSDQFSFSTSITLSFLSDGLPVAFVPVDVKRRGGGKSLVRVGTGFSTLMLILRVIGTFSPLRIFMPPTVLMAVMGATYMVWGLVMESNVGDVAVILIVLSTLLFCFGLLADQLALLRREISRRDSA